MLLNRGLLAGIQRWSHTKDVLVAPLANNVSSQFDLGVGRRVHPTQKRPISSRARHIATDLGLLPPYEPPHDVVLRKASQDDYKQIVGLSKSSFDGHDTMGTRFPTYILDPSRSVAVAEQRGTLVGLHMTRVIDGGEVMMGESGHTSSRFRGHGIYKPLVHYNILETLKAHPRVRMKRGFTTHWHHWSEKLERKDANFVMRMKRHLITLVHQDPLEKVYQVISPASMTTIAGSYDITRAMEEEMSSILNNTTKSKLFPENLILVDYVAFEADTVNLPLMISHNTIWLLEKEAEGLRSISVGTYNQVATGLMLVVDYYGPEDMGCILAHIAHLIRYLPRRHQRGLVSVLLFVGGEQRKFCTEIAEECERVLSYETDIPPVMGIVYESRPTQEDLAKTTL